MKFLKKIFDVKEKQIKSNKDFWDWFVKNEKTFYQIVKNHKNIEKDFLDKLDPRLEQIKEGIFYLVGMKSDSIAELILTPDGNLKIVAVIEKLIKDAPKLKQWEFTALKPELQIGDTNIRMGDYEYNSQNLFFYANKNNLYPDEIDITVVYSNWKIEDKNTIEVGVNIFLDNYLGELNFMTNIDTIGVTGISKKNEDLIPISKLKEFIRWRQKEFIEKYENVTYNSENATYSILEFNYEDGDLGVANINTEVLRWENQASHPWICLIKINYKNYSHNGMPNNDIRIILEELETKTIKVLTEKEGNINIGRTSAKNIRTVYFACKDFRKPSIIFQRIKEDNLNQFEIEFDLYKDKYWQTFNKFKVN